MVEKRVQEINNTLRHLFARERIEIPPTNPIVYVTGQGYRTQFTIRLQESFKT
jgi:hypothetical protein